MDKPTAKAERLVHIDSGTACFHARRALELTVDWIYEYDTQLRQPYDASLSSKIFADDFKNSLPRSVFVKVDYVRRIGNEAVHSRGCSTLVLCFFIVSFLSMILLYKLLNMR
jgi:type I restriction enzyme R subunit